MRARGECGSSLLPSANRGLWCWLWLILLQSIPASADPIARAMEVLGQVRLADEQDQPLVPLAAIAPNSEIVLDPGAYLSIALRGKGVLVRIRGPSRVRLTAEGDLELIEGEQPETATIGTPGLELAEAEPPKAIRLRAAMAPILLRSPEANTLIMDPRPEFRWAAAQAGPFQFRLIGQKGVVLWEQQVAGTTLSLPDSVVLEPGAVYKWQVHFDGREGRSDRRRFVLAQQDLVAAARRAAPAEGASVEELALFALDLRQAGFLDAAEGVIERIESSRPELAAALRQAAVP